MEIEQAPQLPQTQIPRTVAPDTELLDQINSLTRRIRLLEDHYLNIQKKMQVNEQNLLRTDKRTTAEIKTINSELTDVKRAINQIKSDINQIIRELQQTANKDEVNVIKKYLEFWQPVNFVTQNEVERIVEEIVDKKLKK